MLLNRCSILQTLLKWFESDTEAFCKVVSYENDRAQHETNRDSKGQIQVIHPKKMFSSFVTEKAAEYSQHKKFSCKSIATRDSMTCGPIVKYTVCARKRILIPCERVLAQLRKRNTLSIITFVCWWARWGRRKFGWC